MASLVFKPLFSVFHTPRTSLPRVTVEQLRPSSKSVFLFLFVSYAIILSGIIYDAINEPPAIGQGINPRTGQLQAQVIMPNDINGQFIIEGFTASFMICMGVGGLLLLDEGVVLHPKLGVTARWVVIGAGVAMFFLAYNIILAFAKIKLPGYMS